MHLRRLLLAASLAGSIAAAQSLPSNASLKGAYWVRYLGINDGLADQPMSFSGTFTFDGAGSFIVTGSGVAFNNTSAPSRPPPPVLIASSPAD